MSYSNRVKRAHGATINIGGLIADATSIGIPGEEFDLIEKTSLGASRKEWDASDTPDSPEITVTIPNTGQATLASNVLKTGIAIFLKAPNKTLTFNGYVIKDEPQPAEPGGLLYRQLTIKPTTAPVIT